VIETMYATRAAAMRRAWLLLTAALVAVAVTWFRQGTPKIIPETTPFPGAIAGIAIASLTLGMNWSPLVAGIGAMIGPRAGISVLLGGAISWAVLAPPLLKAGIVSEASYGPLSSWLVWPALGLLAAGSFVPILLDPGALRRAFLILIDNAAKYTPLAGTVTVALEARDGFAFASVSDTGIGIAEEDVGHVFDRFWRADKARSREQGGAGLGLSIAKWIVEMHNGSIGVETKLGEGSRFWIRVPLDHV